MFSRNLSTFQVHKVGGCIMKKKNLRDAHYPNINLCSTTHAHWMFHARFYSLLVIMSTIQAVLSLFYCYAFMGVFNKPMSTLITHNFFSFFVQPSRTFFCVCFFLEIYALKIQCQIKVKSKFNYLLSLISIINIQPGINNMTCK